MEPATPMTRCARVLAPEPSQQQRIDISDDLATVTMDFFYRGYRLREAHRGAYRSDYTIS
jgi:hypothetical protein